MLNIFVGEIPSHLNYIFDNESYFGSYELEGSEINKYIINEIDGGSYVDKSVYLDEYGCRLYLTCLSTGAKTLLNIANTDSLCNGVEMGQNALDILFGCVDGNVYFTHTGGVDIPEYIDLSRITINGRTVNTVKELEDIFYADYSTC